jgi:hypothetical protein
LKIQASVTLRTHDDTAAARNLLDTISGRQFDRHRVVTSMLVEGEAPVGIHVDYEVPHQLTQHDLVRAGNSDSPDAPTA